MIDNYMRPLTIAASSFISIYIVFYFMRHTFNKRYKKSGIYTFSFIVLWLLFFLSNLHAIGFVNMLLTISMLFGLGFFLFDAKKSKGLLTILFFLIFLFFSEIVGSSIWSIVFNVKFSTNPGGIVRDIITFTGCHIIVLLMEKKKKSSYHIAQWYLILVVPSLSISIMLAILHICGETTDKMKLVLSSWAYISIFLVNIFIFFLFDRLSELSYQKEQYSMLQQQAEMQYRYYNELERKYENSRRLSHDIKNHLIVLKEMYSKNSKDAEDYTNELGQELEKNTITYKTSSKVLTILLSHYIELSNNYHVKFDYVIEEIDFSFISEFDLAILFSNLLDNSMDECTSNHLEQNYISLQICHINHFIVILLKNSSEKNPKIQGGKLITQKQGHMGIGISNIKNIVDKYDGDISIQYETNLFTVQITFSGLKTKLEFAG